MNCWSQCPNGGAAPDNRRIRTESASEAKNGKEQMPADAEKNNGLIIMSDNREEEDAINII